VPQSLWWRWAFLGMVALRILWDFSGYSDLALGFARVMGVGCRLTSTGRICPPTWSISGTAGTSR